MSLFALFMNICHSVSFSLVTSCLKLIFIQKRRKFLIMPLVGVLPVNTTISSLFDIMTLMNINCHFKSTAAYG